MIKKKYFISFGVVILLGIATEYVMLAMEKAHRLLAYVICGVVVSLVGCVLVREEMQHSSGNSSAPKAITSASEFSLPDDEIALLKKSANEGDCQAANRLGMYHFFHTLRNDEAIIWFRLAAECPKISYKEGLVAVLLAERDQTKVSAEIDQLIIDMKKLDPEAEVTKRSEAEVLRRRQVRNPQ